MTSRHVFYFAYGSNADPDRFRARVGEWASRVPAWLENYRLRFAKSVQSEGGGGAVVDPSPGDRVAGVLYEITGEQLLAMDREEFDHERDHSRTGRRMRLEVQAPDGPRKAEIYTVEDDGGFREPSPVYLNFIVTGLKSVDHDEDAIASVRQSARSQT